MRPVPTIADEDRLPIFTKFVNSCWFCFKWSIALVFVTVLVVGGYLYLRLDDEIRRYAESTLADHYQGHVVTLGDARFEAGRGVIFHNLSIFDTNGGKQLRQVVHIDELHLLGNFDAESLVAGRSQIERVIVKQPRIDAVRTIDGQWNVAQLLPLPESGGRHPDVDITDAVISLTDASRPEMKPLVVREIRLRLTSDKTLPASGDPTLPTPRWQYEGSIGGALAQSIKVAGWYDPQNEALAADVDIVDLALTGPLLRSWPLPGAPWLARADLNGKLDCDITIARAATPQATIEWHSTFELTEGRLSIDGLPRQMTELVARGAMSQGGLRIESAGGRYGKAAMSLVGVRDGWGSGAPLHALGRIEGLVLDDTVTESLPASVAALWNRFRPAGEVNADFNIGFNGQRWLPDVSVVCQNAAFEDAHHFPYRVRGGSGTLRYHDVGPEPGGQLEVHLTAHAGNQPIHIDGTLANLSPPDDDRYVPSDDDGPSPTGRLVIHGEQITISTALVDALGENQQKVIRQLEPQGNFSFRWTYEHPSLEVPETTSTDLEFHDCQIRFDRFPYPLTNISGRITERNGFWQFTDLVSHTGGDNHVGQRVVRCDGTCQPVHGEHLLQLTFRGEQIPLDDTLRQALPIYLQPHWISLNPSGRAGFTAQVRYETSETAPRVELVAWPEDKSVAVLPNFFRYRLEGIDGEFRFQNGQVVMTNVSAHHGGRTRVAAQRLHWLPSARGGWQCDVLDLNVDRLQLLGNYELLLDAPVAIRKLVDQLQPTGSFSIHNGQVRVTKASEGAPNACDWNLRVGLQQNDFELGVPLRNVSGMVALAGRYHDGHSYSAGNLELESLFWQGLQFTQVRGPFWFDNRECHFGEQAAQRHEQMGLTPPTLRHLRTNFYGGELALNGVVLHELMRYSVEGRLRNTSLEQMSTEYLNSSVALTGTMGGNFNVSGMGQSLDLLSGGGNVQVRDATMGELPIMVSMLKVLRNRAPDTTAFNGVDAQFRLVGKKVHFEQLDILGDAISLKGKGTVGFDRQANLDFYSYMGRHEINIPVVRQMLGQASANLLQISVTGPIDNARVTREALPAVGSIIDQFNERGETASPSSPTGSWWR